MQQATKKVDYARAGEVYFCRCCDRKLDPKKMVWLELSFRTNRWYPGDTCPPAESQGNFPFGAACARKTLRKQRAAS